MQGDYSYASGHAAADRLADAGADAIFCTSDAMAMSVLDARRAEFPGGKPRRFRLYGFDNLSMTDSTPIPSPRSATTSSFMSRRSSCC